MRAQENTMKTLSLKTAAVLGLVALSACRIEKPSTVVPPPPSVDSFTAATRSVVKDGKVLLSWKTSNATAVELREASTGALSVAESTLEGSFEATITADSLFVLTARGAGGTDARAVSVSLDGGGVKNVAFEALPSTIAGGASTTLVWSALGARAVTLKEGTTDVDLRGQRTNGAVTVSPRFDTTYTLTVDGTPSTAVVSVQPAVLTLSASPLAVEVGQPVTLSWTAAGATKLVITSPGRGQLVEITDAARIATGTFDDVVPTLPSGGVVAYEVAAVKGTEMLSKTVEVFVGAGLTISRFDAPPVAAAAAPYAVRWLTVSADQVDLKVDGVVVHRTASRTEAAAGVFTFTAPANDFAVEIVATNVRGDRKTQLAQVDSVGVPTTATLTATPTSVASGDAVTLTFACAEARRLRITDTIGQIVYSVSGQLAEGGTVTVHPTSDTTYTLTADNLLGSTPITATAAVTVTGTPLTLAQTPPTAISGQNVGVSVAAANALYTGFPHNQILKSSQADFIDIKATGVRVLETGSNVTTVDLPFTTWIWGSKQAGLLTVSRAGWIAWGAPLTVNSSETTLPSTSTSAPPFLIAPFWDDLTLTANSAVVVQVIGNAPEQSLVVQWERLQVGTSTSTEVTFQVRVHQNGVVSFHYKTMTLSSSTYSSFTAGLQDGTRKLARVVTGTPVSNTAVYFFSPVTAIDTRVFKGSRYGGLVEVQGVKTLLTRPAVALDVPADLSLSELMFRPASSSLGSQFLELNNSTTTPIDLTGWVIGASGSASSFSFPSGFTLAPSSYTVVGSTVDPLLNDDAGVSLAWSPLVLSRDSGVITFSNVDAGLSLSYVGPADGGEGSSVEFDPTVLARGGGLATCSPPKTFGSQTPLQHGSPGAATNCMGYVSSSITSRFVDITATGTRVFNDVSDEDVAELTLAATGTDPAPIAFGVRRPVVSVSSNGWLTWGAAPPDAAYSNKTLPNSSDPLGTLAPFWDDLEAYATGADIYWKRFAANEDPVTTAPHWVIQWSHYTHFIYEDDLNFEVKLFENGTIEYHYGVMTSDPSSSTNYGNGNSATVWLEDPTGSFAIAKSINQPLVAPNTAWRFSPVP
jgi:Lamin Tail Domain